MHIGEKNIFIDDALFHKIKLMCKRCTKQKFDNLLIIDGDEGYGKSNLAVIVAYAVSILTGRKFSNDNIYFDADDMVNAAKDSKDQIILWDEAAIAGLASEWQRKIQKKLIKMLMIARKKRHFYIICIPKFNKLNEYLIHRAIGMLRVYAKNEIDLGNFAFYGRTNIKGMMNIYNRKKVMLYNKYYLLRGRFNESLPKIINEERYESDKDKAIIKALTDEDKAGDVKSKFEYNHYVKLMGFVKSLEEHFKLSEKEIERLGKLPRNSIQIWRNQLKSLEKRLNLRPNDANIINK